MRPSSGFFLIKREVAGDVPRISAGRSDICLELPGCARGRATTVAEVPYVFVGRTVGESKMNHQRSDRCIPPALQPDPLHTLRAGNPPDVSASSPRPEGRHRSPPRPAPRETGPLPAPVGVGGGFGSGASATRGANRNLDDLADDVLLGHEHPDDVAGVAGKIRGRRKKRRAGVANGAHHRSFVELTASHHVNGSSSRDQSSDTSRPWRRAFSYSSVPG